MIAQSAAPLWAIAPKERSPLAIPLFTSYELCPGGFGGTTCSGGASAGGASAASGATSSIGGGVFSSVSVCAWAASTNSLDGGFGGTASGTFSVLASVGADGTASAG